jgi:hypothetical protein
MSVRGSHSGRTLRPRTSRPSTQRPQIGCQRTIQPWENDWLSNFPAWRDAQIEKSPFLSPYAFDPHAQIGQVKCEKNGTALQFSKLFWATQMFREKEDYEANKLYGATQKLIIKSNEGCWCALYTLIAILVTSQVRRHTNCAVGPQQNWKQIQMPDGHFLCLMVYHFCSGSRNELANLCAR